MVRWWSLRFFTPATWSAVRAARLTARSGGRGGENGSPRVKRAWLPALIGGLALLALHLVLFPPLPRSGVDFPRQGEVAEKEIRAPFAFKAALPQREIELLRLERVLVEPPVLRRANWARGGGALDRYIAWREAFLALRSRRGTPLEERVETLAARFPELDKEDLRRALGLRRVDDSLDAMRASLGELLDAGVVDMLPPGKYTQVRVLGADTETTLDAGAVTPQTRLPERLPYVLRAHGLDAETAAWAARLAAPLLVPNLAYDPAETRARQDLARQAVPAEREFIRGERIVDQGVRVSEQEALFLSQLRELLATRGGGAAAGPLLARLASRLLLVMATLALYGWLGALYFPGILIRVSFLTAVCGALALFLAAASFSLARSDLGVFAVPVPLLALLVTVLFKDRVGYVTTVLGVALLAPLPGTEAAAIFVWLLLGTVTVSAVRHIQQRSQFYRTIGVLCALSIFLISVLRLMAGISLFALGGEYLVGLLSPVAAVAFALFLLPIVEPAIGVASDLTLLELSDLNHPLLKQMALESQGTYHHSQVVSQLAEQAARAIGANALLTRVGALFHDIGKLSKPEYFVENQRGGPNKHDELSPSMSALVVGSHVKEGIELGRRWRLPQAVIDFIPEHHGTGVMEFFYHKALESAEEETVKVDDFRYPGPKPRCRETAILMLADAVEASARSLVKPSPGRIREVTKQVIDKRLLSGELDEAQLTMADLARIREAFIPLLAGIHHARISYPGKRERDGARPGERETARGRERDAGRQGERTGEP